LDKLKVRLASVDLAQRKIDFVPADMAPPSGPKRKRRRRG
jgi:hypothetical protein